MGTKVFICDDEPDIAQVWKGAISEAIAEESQYDPIEVPDRSAISNSIKMLIERQERARDGTDVTQTGCLFDQADVLIIDYDLVHIDDNSTRYTGEGIARLARAFSTVGVIVVLNQHPEVQFDLSLRGNLESHADMNIEGELIGSKGLWTEEVEKTGFLPWYWPMLSDATDRFRSRCEFVLLNLDKPILPSIGFGLEEASALSDSAFGFLGPNVDNENDLMRVTFDDFTQDNSNAVDIKNSQNISDTAKSRICAARLSKWLERSVLGAQDILIDLPHLMQRMPFLFDVDVSDIGGWNASTAKDAAERLKDEAKPYVLEQPNWLSKPAIWWPRLTQDLDVQKVRSTFDYGLCPNFVFLEDTSQFVEIEEAREFRAAFHNQYDLRFAKEVEDIKYAPRRRFAMAGS